MKCDVMSGGFSCYAGLVRGLTIKCDQPYVKCDQRVGP